jgi:glycosyltransferase involved in cell wall biosynthesis
MNNPPKFILYAPNVNSGGGFALLKSLLIQWQGDESIHAILDYRIIDKISTLNLKKINVVYYVKNNIYSLIKAEIKLWSISNQSTKILCFHNLPPILSRGSKVFIFLQNRLIIRNNIGSLTSKKRYLIILFEKFISRAFTSKSFQYITQSESMKSDATTWLSSSPKSKKHSLTIHVLPFMPDVESTVVTLKERQQEIKWHFLCVSTAERHKNHLNLIKAWELLHLEGINPTLALTITKDTLQKQRGIDWQILDKLDIDFLGHLAPQEVNDAYLATKALILPSHIESFGLPLIEASRLNIPILAGELDYVRDVCNPAETFDPNSPLSISRAVKRFLHPGDQAPQKLLSPSEFWDTFCTLK